MHMQNDHRDPYTTADDFGALPRPLVISDPDDVITYQIDDGGDPRTGHVDGWRSRPCSCFDCRADRIANRIVWAVVILGIAYIAAHVIAAIAAGRL